MLAERIFRLASLAEDGHQRICKLCIYWHIWAYTVLLEQVVIRENFFSMENILFSLLCSLPVLRYGGICFLFFLYSIFISVSLKLPEHWCTLNGYLKQCYLFFQLPSVNYTITPVYVEEMKRVWSFSPNQESSLRWQCCPIIDTIVLLGEEICYWQNCS